MKTKGPKTLKSLFFQRLLLTFALPLIIIGGIAIGITLPQERKKAIQRNAITAQNISKIISVDLAGGETFLKGVASLYTDGDTLYKTYVQKFSKSENSDTFFDNIYILDSTGRVSWFYPFTDTKNFRSFSYSGVTYRYKDFFTHAREQKKPIWSEIYTSLITGNRTVTLLVPFEKGFFAADLNMQGQVDKISTLTISEEVRFSILDRFGNYIYHPSEDQLYKYSQIPELSKEQEESQAILFTEENQLLLGIPSTITESGWVVLVSQGYLNIMKDVLFWATVLLTLFVAMFLFALYTSLSSSKQMSTLLEETESQAASVGAGNYLFSPLTLELHEFTKLNSAIHSMAQAVHIREDEIRQAQIQAEEQFKFQQRLIDSISNPVFVICNDRDLLLANTACIETIGTSADILILLLEDNETTLTFTDGKEHRVLIQRSHFTQSNSQTVDVVSITDITHRMELESRLHHSEKLQSIGKLAGGIAHDVNNQLSGILGYAELIKNQTAENDSIRPFVQGIIDAVGLSSDITHQLLAFARHGQYSLKEISLHELAEGAADILRHTISRKIDLSIEKSNVNPIIMADKSQIQNAILNLGINARDAIGDKQGEIIIKVYRKTLTEPLENFNSVIPEGDYGVICVCDTGSGIKESNVTRIFEPFYTTKPEGKGTGMGLAAVYGTVSTHDGYIQVESVLGEGTCFNLFFPNIQGVMTKTSSQRHLKQESAHPNTKATILIIDDDTSIRISTTKLLQIKGFYCYSAENGALGVETFTEHKEEIDLVLLDANMPVMNGYEAFQELRRLSPDLWIIMITGYADEGNVQELMQTHNCDYLHKPFKIDALLEKIAIGLK